MKLTVKWNHAKQWLLIGDEIEGQVYREPNAQQFGSQYHGPGAISASAYTYSFILAAYLHPQGHGLVFGLGAGAGIVMLLALFPQLTLTVIEINAKLIELAKTHFPLIRYYIEQGRLSIQQQSAADFVSHQPSFFDFTIIDIYKGDEDCQENITLLPQIAPHTHHIIANLIANFSDYDCSALLSNLKQKTQQDFVLFKCHMNWILSNISQLPIAITEFSLFPHVSTDSAKMANEMFKTLLKQVPAKCFY